MGGPAANAWPFLAAAAARILNSGSGSRGGGAAAAARWKSRILTRNTARKSGAAASAKNKRGISRATYLGKNNKYYKPGSKYELKFIDTTQDPTNTNSGTGTPAPLCSAYIINPVQQGPTQNQRIGKSYNMKSINIRLKVVRGTNSGTPVNVTVRVLLVYVKESNTNLAGGSSSAAGLGYVLAYTPSNAGTSYKAITSPLSLNNTGNMIVLKDVIQELDFGHGEEWYWQYYHKCNLNTEMLLSATDGTTYADYKNGSLWLLITDNNYGVYPSIHSFATRVRYYDA